MMSRIHNVGFLLPQWIEYNYLLGFEHFYIVDDCSTSERGSSVYWGTIYEISGIASFFTDLAFLDCTNHKPDESRILRFMFAKARNDCDWISFMDVDEYIFPVVVADHLENFSITKYLNNSLTTPIIRMPWLTMGSDNQEKRPTGLLIESYRIGKYDHPLLKTIAHNDVIGDWSFTQLPWIKNKPSHKKIKYYEKNGYKLDNYTYLKEVKKFAERLEINFTTELKSVTINSKQCKIPISPLYLRHYRFLNWHDLIITRGSRPYSSHGMKSELLVF
jgi:hypothetical protein